MALALSGCSREYQSERYLYSASKKAKNIILNPEAIPPQELQRALDAYKTVYEKYPDTAGAKRARVAIGSLYLIRKDFQNARDVFNKAVELYPDDKLICLEARSGIAKSYENEGLWNNALTEYKSIIKDYAVTEAGLTLPLYIADHYAKEKDILGRDNAYNEAILHYTGLNEKYRNTLLGYRADELIVTCNMKKDDWSGAADALRKMIMDYPMAKTVPMSMRMLSDISVNRLKAPERALDVMKEFLARYPKHPLSGFVIKGIEVLNNANVTK